MILWNTLIKLKRILDSTDNLPGQIFIELGGETRIQLDKSLPAPDITLTLNRDCSSPFDQGVFQIESNSDNCLSQQDLKLFELYLPYTCLAYFARKRKKCFSISHFAQTLDGRIASCTGDSKWIGNEDNLIHAHRMRALCDAILVGAKTVERDNPRLNVRKVSGVDPIKVIVGGNGQFSSQRFHAIDANTIVFKDHSLPEEPFECVVIPKSPYYKLSEVLETLASKGIYSVYIEGGSYTTSSFLKQQELDQIQLHFSNKILGSGTHSFLFEGISDIQNAITFKKSDYYPIGNEIMFVGNIG